jgi:hypothetical protein
MPASVVLAAIGAQLTGVALAVATFAINFAASYIITRVFGRQASKQQDSGVRQQVPPSSTNCIPIVYGDAWMGGTFVDAVLTTDQKVMYYVLAISNISPNGQFTFDRTKFYYGDRLITFDGADPTKVVFLTDGASNPDDKIAGNLYINLYTSTAAGSITNVTGTSPSSFMGGTDIDPALRWTGTRQMNGLAFAIVKLIYNRDAGTTSLQPITFKVKHALNSTGVAKPGDVLYDYLTQPYGGAVTAANVNSSACAALNTYSDATITYTPSGGGSATQARYRINGVIDTGRSVLDNVDKILTSCDSWLSYQATTGQWAPIINKADSTGFAFNDSNIIGNISVSVVDLASSINQIEVSFPFKENKDQPEYVFLQTPSGQLYPNEPVNKYTTSFDLVNDSVQATYLANRILEQAREDLIVSFSTAYTGIQVDAGDVISITNTDYGWSSKLFRVTKVQEASLPDGNLGAKIECSEYNSNVYDDGSIQQFTQAANSDIASVYYFPDLSAPTFSDEQPAENPPKFSVTCQLPSSGRVTSVSLFYTTVATPTQTDWKIWATQLPSNSEPFSPGVALKFTDVILGTDNYYFAFSVSNELGSSKLSAASSVFSWATFASSTFIAIFQPPSTSIPRTNGTPSFTGIVTQLYGSNAIGIVDFVTSQTDADAAFINNTWRIGNSDITGDADITTTGGLVMGSITDGGTYAQWGAPTAMTTTGATLSVPVRYKDQNGNVTQYSASKISFTFVDNGTDGTRTARLQLYKWLSTAPTLFPTGTSTYTWADATFTNPTLNGWTQVPGAGSPGQNLYSVIQEYVDTDTTATSTVTWSTTTASIVGYAGDNGTRTAQLELFQWASSTPTTFPSGSSTYTWATATFTNPTLNGWTQSPGAGSPGQTLYACKQLYSDTNTTATSSVTWTTSTAYIVGYAGSNGTNGSSSRICFSRIPSNPSPVSGNITVSGDNRPTQAQSNTTWGLNVAWSASDPNTSSTDSLYQADGTYNPVTNQTIWSTPYISSLKVGTLSAITVNTGALDVQDALTINTLGHIKGGQTAYNTGTGFFLGYSVAAYKFSIGSSTQSLTWDGSAMTVTGNIYGTGTSEFTGASATGFGLTAAVKANTAGGADLGVWGRSNTTGFSAGIYGNSAGIASSAGVYAVATTTTSIGAVARNVSGGTALAVEGPMTMTSTTLVTNLNADKLDGKDASAFVEIATGTTNDKYIYYVDNTSTPVDPNNRAAWIKVSTNDGSVVFFPGYI